MVWVAAIALGLAAVGAVAWLRDSGRMGHTLAHLVEVASPSRIGGASVVREPGMAWTRSGTVRLEGRTLTLRLTAMEDWLSVTLEAPLSPEVPFQIVVAAVGGPALARARGGFVVPLLGSFPIDCPPEVEAQVRDALGPETCKQLRGPLARGVSVLGKSVRLNALIPRPNPWFNLEELSAVLEGKLHYDEWARDVLAAAAALSGLPFEKAPAPDAALEPSSAEAPPAPAGEPDPELPLTCALCGVENAPGATQCGGCARPLDTPVQERFNRAVLQKKDKLASQLSESLDREAHEEAFRERHGAELQRFAQRLFEEGEKARADYEARQAAKEVARSGLLLAGGVGGGGVGALVSFVRMVTGMRRSTGVAVAVGVGILLGVGALRHADDGLLVLLFLAVGVPALLGAVFGRRG